MDAVFGEITGCGVGSDSIMLGLLRSAMDKAHENVETTDGSVELLSARSKFYELAMILVEGCSKLIEEKAEVPETNREKMLSDLMESKTMIMGRLKELRIGMFEKDRELLKGLENEWKLRQALELKERELVSLRAKVEFERTKSEGFDEGKGEGGIRELKHSVDQQVWSIKQHLEDERISLSGGNEFPPGSEDFGMTSENEFMRPEQKIVIERMSSDIDGLKETLDLAFGRMHHVEMRPLENQWGWEIEKQTMLILIEGFMESVGETFDLELEKRTKNESPSGLLGENWGQLMEEITCLHRELGDLCSSSEKDAKGVKTHETLELPTKIRRASSEPLPEHGVSEDQPCNEDEDGDVSHVAKMIKSHESIIRKQREELNRLKREMILREKEESLSSKRLQDPNDIERRVQDVVARLDNVIKWKGKIQDEVGKVLDGQELGEKVCIGSMCCIKQAGLNDETRRLKQEWDDSKSEIMIMEETYAILFKGLLKDFYLELENETTSATRDDIFTFSLKEIVEEWRKGMDSDSSGNLIKEERNQFPICKPSSQNHQDVRALHDSLESSIESKLKEDIYMVFIREMIRGWKMEFDAHKFENLIREEIHNFLVVEAAKYSYTSLTQSDKSPEVFAEENLIQTLHCDSGGNLLKEERNQFPIFKSFSRNHNHQEARTPLNYLEMFMESKLKEDICMAFIREMVMEWRMELDAQDFENLIREEIYSFLITEATKDSLASPRGSDKTSEVLGEENLIQTLDCLLKCVEAEEDLMLKASCEIKEHSADNDLVATECEEVDERDAIEWLLTEEENTFCSVSSKLEEALQHLFISKELLRDLQGSLAISVDDMGKVYERENSFGLPRDNQIVQLNPLDANLLPLQQMLAGFESIVQQKLERNFTRLKELEHQTYIITQPMALLRKRESLYKKAFSRRCHNLRLAETEVDLLGDRVDVLVGLLEKIYLTLDQYSQVLLPHFRVFEILKLIKREISGVAPEQGSKPIFVTF